VIDARSSIADLPTENRFIRSLKEQVIWLRRFRTVAELDRALRDLAHRFNNHWIIGRIGY